MKVYTERADSGEMPIPQMGEDGARFAGSLSRRIGILGRWTGYLLSPFQGSVFSWLTIHGMNPMAIIALAPLGLLRGRVPVRWLGAMVG